MNLLFILILVILIFDFFTERILDFLNAKNRKADVPEELANIYSSKEYEKSVRYEKVVSRFTQISSAFSFAIMLSILVFGGFAYLNQFVGVVSENAIIQAITFFAVLYFASDIATMPFSMYRVFKIEEKFGFNKMTLKTFFVDKIKTWFISIFFAGLLISVATYFYNLTPEYFWIYAWLLVVAISLFLNMFYSSLIVPLFNKQTPLDEGSLRTAIQSFAERSDFQLDNVFIIDGSKRSTKANAYFSGLGKKKRIVLYDTLINDLTDEEIVAVLAHEVGHYKLKHTRTGLIMTTLQTGLMFYIFSLFATMPELSRAIGVAEPNFHIALTAFALLYSPLSMILGIGMNIISRKNEYDADAFAGSFGFGDALISSLKKLTSKNLSNLTPHPLYVFFYFSHPELLKRINALKNN